MYSIWKQTSRLPAFPSFSAHAPVDAAIIGGGLAGILCAYFLQQKGLSVLLLEANQIGSGQTGNTTAKITAQHGLCYDSLIRQKGFDAAALYGHANQKAIDSYEKLIQDLKISCDFQRLPAYLYTNQQPELLGKEWKAARRLNLPAHLTSHTSLPFSVSLALRFDKQAQFHPLRFLAALSGQIPIVENTKVLDVQEDRIITSHGYLSANTIIFACHYPFINFPGLYFLRMHQERSYCLALEKVPALDGMYLGIDKGAYSFRSYGSTLIIGGGSHRCGENSLGSRYQVLSKTALKYWPSASTISSWSAQDCMTLDHLPYIGQFSKQTPSWYVCTGFGKWGMALSMISAQLLTDLICHQKNPLESLLSPQRPLSKSAVSSFTSEAGHSLKGLRRSYLSIPSFSLSQIPPGHGDIIQYHGKQVGVYRHPKGKLYMVLPRCPHLGCRLEWNPDEHSWDCPCHGSRFSYDGTLLNGPAQQSLTRIKP